MNLKSAPENSIERDYSDRSNMLKNSHNASPFPLEGGRRKAAAPE
jgi:hypothetical protein